jgi:Putative DNA-binding domain
MPLGRMQRWLQEVVVHPGTVDEAIASARRDLPPERLADVVLASRTLTPAERVEIYQRMYLLRMEEALGIDYPGLQHFLGQDGFRHLVRDYVATFPSRSYTLNRLGDHLAEFILTAPGLRHRSFCHDLARLELAMTEVFDEAETPAVSADVVAAVPPEKWPEVRLRPIAAFRLLAVRYPVNAYVSSVGGKANRHPHPRRQDAWLAVFRREYGVHRLELTRPAYDLLSELASGRTLGDAVTAAARRRGAAAARETQLYRWFRQWMASGLFAGIDP